MRALSAEEGGGQRDAARGPAHDRRMAAAGGQRVDRALADAAKGHAGVLEPRGRVMRAPAEQRELQRDALVQRPERAGAIGRDVVGDEEHRHRSASS